jgi:hypothetical protein
MNSDSRVTRQSDAWYMQHVIQIEIIIDNLFILFFSFSCLYLLFREQQKLLGYVCVCKLGVCKLDLSLLNF